MKIAASMSVGRLAPKHSLNIDGIRAISKNVTPKLIENDVILIDRLRSQDGKHLTMLENYEIDLAIVEGKASDHALNSLVLDTDFLVCVMSSDNPLSKNAMITLDQLKRERMILRLPTSATRILFDSTLRSLNDSPENYNIAIEVDNIATIKDLIRKDLGVSVLPKSSCVKELSEGKLVALPIENLSMVRETRIVYGKDFAHKEILQTITKVYHETVKAFR